MEMRRTVALGLVLMACMALSACPQVMRVVLLNNSGHVVQVIHASPDGDRGAKPNTFPWIGALRWPYLIDHGGDRVLMQHGMNNIIELRVGDCLMWYQIPPPPNDYRSDLALQIQPDLAIYLAPYGVQETMAKTQPPGFPASPTEQRCN